MRRDLCLLPVRRATKSTKESHSSLVLPGSHSAVEAVPLVQGAACSIPHGWGTSQTRQADTQLTLALFPLTFPCSLSGLRSPAISHHGFHVAQTEGGCIKSSTYN